MRKHENFVALRISEIAFLIGSLCLEPSTVANLKFGLTFLGENPVLLCIKYL